MGRTIEAVSQLSQDEEAGEPDLLVQDNRVFVVFRSGSSQQSNIMSATSDDGGRTWQEPTPVSPANLYAEFPSLAPTGDGQIDLEFYGDARDSNASDKSLKRFYQSYHGANWSQPRRALTNFPSVRSSWLQVNFRLNTHRAAYQPHGLSILFNEYPLFEQKDAIPEGTFLLPLSPALLRFDEHGLPANMVGLRTQHMDQAHYSSAAGFRLQARQARVERHVVARSQSEANRLLAAEAGEANRSLADVGLFSIPQPAPLQTPAQNAIVELPLLVANLGRGVATGVELHILNRHPQTKSVIEPTRIGVLEAMESKQVVVKFPYGGAERYHIVARATGADFNPRNNHRVVSFEVREPGALRAQTPKLEGPFGITIADEPITPHLCRLMDAETDQEVRSDRERQTAQRGAVGQIPTAHEAVRL